MARSVYLVRTRSPPVTCIVNDAHLGQEGVCGRAAAEERECSTPVCADHLCQYRRSNGHRCKNTPLRLLQGLIYNAVGLFPNTSASANCARHEKYNCIGFINENSTVRCAGTKVQGRDHCAAHAAELCKWKSKDGRFCSQEALQGSRYCRGHCWYEPSRVRVPVRKNTKLTGQLTQRSRGPTRLPMQPPPMPIEPLLQRPPLRVEERCAHAVRWELVPKQPGCLRRAYLRQGRLRERSARRRRPLRGACVRLPASRPAQGLSCLHPGAAGGPALVRTPRRLCSYGWAGGLGELSRGWHG